MIWIGYILLVLINVFVAFLIKMSRKTTFWGRIVLLLPPLAIFYGIAFLSLTLFYFIKYYLKD